MRPATLAALLAAASLSLSMARADAEGRSASDAVGWGEGDESEGPSDSDESATDAIGWGEAEDTSDEVGWGDPSAGDGASSGSVDFDEPSRLAIGGTLRHEMALWTRRFGDNAFAKARTSVDLWLRAELRRGRLVLGAHGEYDLAYLYRREGYDQPTIDNYETLFRAGESYLALDRPRVTLSVGTQIVAFGHADVLSVVDMVNPRDLREMILTDPMDLRVPVLMSRVAYASGALRFELAFVHEAYFDLMPPPFGTWSPIRRPVLEDPRVAATPLPSLLPDRDVYYDHRPRRISLESQQVFGRFSLNAGPVDVGLYAGVYRDPIGTVTLPSVDEFIANDVVHVRLDHLRVQTLAASMSFVRGRVVGWAEIAADVRRPVNVEHETDFVATERRTLFRWTAGLRYETSRGGIVGLEYAQGSTSFPSASEAELLVPILPTTLLARVERAFVRDRFRMRLLGAVTGERLRGGAILIAELAYALSDGLSVGGGYALFSPWNPEASLIWGYTEHDRVFARLRYDFAR